MTKSQGSHRAKMVENLYILFFLELDDSESKKAKKKISTIFGSSALSRIPRISNLGPSKPFFDQFNVSSTKFSQFCNDNRISRPTTHHMSVLDNIQNFRNFGGPFQPFFSQKWENRFLKKTVIRVEFVDQWYITWLYLVKFERKTIFGSFLISEKFQNSPTRGHISRTGFFPEVRSAALVRQHFPPHFVAIWRKSCA